MNPTKSFLTIEESHPDNSKFGIKDIIEYVGSRLLLTHERVKVEMDNATGNMEVWEKPLFTSLKQIRGQISRFLSDLQPEHRTNPRSIQPCSHGALGTKYAESTVEKYGDHEIKFVDSLI